MLLHPQSSTSLLTTQGQAKEKEDQNTLDTLLGTNGLRIYENFPYVCRHSYMYVFFYC